MGMMRRGAVTHYTTDQVLAYADKIVKGKQINKIDIIMQDRQKTDNSHAELFAQRGEAFVRGVNVVINNLETNELNDPDARIKIRDAVSKLYSDYAAKLKSVKIHSPMQGKPLLDTFLAKVAILLEDQTTMSAQEAAHRMTIAERVANWNSGRKSLVTISDAVNPATDKPQVIVQVEVPRCKLTLAQKKEFVNLVTENSKPEWFNSMPKWERNCLLEHLKEHPKADLNNIDDKILTIPTLLRHVPGLANYTEHVLRVYEPDDQGLLTIISESRRERSGVVCPVDLYKSKYDDERQRITDDNVAQVLFSMEDRALRFAEKWEADSFSIPVTYQTLLSPGIVTSILSGGANDNAMMIRNKDEAIEKLKNALANPADPECKKYLEQLGLKMNDQGAIQYADKNGKPIFVKPIIVSTNHSVNAWRVLPEPFKTDESKSNGINSVILLAQVGDFLQGVMAYFKNKNHLDIITDGQWGSLIKELQELGKFSSIRDLPKDKRENIAESIHACLGSLNDSIGHDKLNDLQVLLQAVSDYLQTPGMERTNQHRPFFLSSLEQIISDKLGGVGYGSCKSGKDRKGLEILHTDAMLIYQCRYGTLPRYDDKDDDRKNFVAICVELYRSRHQHEIAAQNAHGARGIKELKNILPKDILKAIGKEELKEADRYGNLNKVNTRLLNQKEVKKQLQQEVMKVETEMNLPRSQPKEKKKKQAARSARKIFSLFKLKPKKEKTLAEDVVKNKMSRPVR